MSTKSWFLAILLAFDKEGVMLDYSFELTSDLKCYQGV